MPRFVACAFIVAAIVGGCSRAGAPSSSAVGAGALAGVESASAKRPTFELTVTGGPDGGSYSSDRSAVLDYCLHNSDGSWRMQYLGGQPVVSIDMLVANDAAQASDADHVATEIVFDDQTLKFDPSDLRGGDIKGRSTARVEVQTAEGATSFLITAVTPDRSSGADGSPDKVTLTVVCRV
jgi:hypothetical protein